MNCEHKLCVAVDDITRVTRVRVDSDDSDIFISESTTAHRDIRTTSMYSVSILYTSLAN